MPIEKRSHTIKDFFNKKQKSNKDVSVSTTSNDIADLINLQVDDSINLGTLTINSQTTTTLNICFNMCAVSRSIDDILGLVENADDGTLPPATESISLEKTILLDIGSDLREIKRVIEECDNLIKRTTEVDSSREKILYDISEFANRLTLSSKTILDKCSIEIESLKSDRRTYVVKDSGEKDIINRDPGALTHEYKFSDDELRYLVSKGPFQPHIDFPANEE